MYKFPELNRVDLRTHHPFLSFFGGFELEKAAQIMWDTYKKSLKVEWSDADFEDFNAKQGFFEWIGNKKYFQRLSNHKYLARSEFFEMVEKRIKEVNPKYLNGIKYPITVYSFGVSNTLYETTFHSQPAHHFDCHYIKGNKFIESNYDINYEFYLDKQEAVAELKEQIELDIRRGEESLAINKVRLENLIQNI